MVFIIMNPLKTVLFPVLEREKQAVARYCDKDQSSFFFSCVISVKVFISLSVCAQSDKRDVSYSVCHIYKA